MDFERIYMLLKIEELARGLPHLDNILTEVRDELKRHNDGSIHAQADGEIEISEAEKEDE